MLHNCLVILVWCNDGDDDDDDDADDEDDDDGDDDDDNVGWAKRIPTLYHFFLQGEIVPFYTFTFC